MDVIEALKTHLKALAVDSNDSFAPEIRRIVGPREAVHYLAPLRRMILAIPSMIEQMDVWTGKETVPPRLIKLHASTLKYLYHPTNYLPRKSPGLFGYLDDAYFVAGCYLHILRWKVATRASRFVNPETLTSKIQVGVESCRQLLPDMTSEIDSLLDQMLKGHPGNSSGKGRIKGRWFNVRAGR